MFTLANALWLHLRSEAVGNVPTNRTKLAPILLEIRDINDIKNKLGR